MEYGKKMYSIYQGNTASKTKPANGMKATEAKVLKYK